MRRWERWSFNALNGVVAATGFAYLWMKYVLQTDDPFAVVNHPWQPAALALHVVAAPLLMMVFGIVFRSHVLGKLTSGGRRARRTGWTSVVSFALMAVSGYLLQVAAEPEWLRWLMVTHVASGTLFVVGYAAHLAVGWRLALPRVERGPTVEPRPVNPS